jgi:hypothetical protein
MINLTKNDISWYQIFDQYDIVNKINDNGKFIIEASQINQFREARLMTKFDNHSNLPKIFRDNNLSILPITRGSYVIAPFETYCIFPENIDKTQITYLNFPDHIQSLDPRKITSEAIAMNCAYLSKMIDDFVGDEGLVPTISGRMSSSDFLFNINNLSTNNTTLIQVQNSQIEIDGCYEGLETLSIIEAKNSISTDFLIRQMYYPYRKLKENISKTVKTIFLVYTNNIFTLYEYIFDDPENYNSLRLNKVQRYSFERTSIQLIDIQKVIASSGDVDEPRIPFPQADSFARIINLCELLLARSMTKEDIGINYDFTIRQAYYYCSAGEYLGLLKQNGKEVYLTDEGKRILSLSLNEKQLAFAKIIIKHKVFKESLISYLHGAIRPTEDDIVKIMKASNLYNINGETTYKRRSLTVISWVNWILDLLD